MPGFKNCSWCYGKGCMCCDAEQKKWEAEREREYERQFPNGPQPIFSARRDDPDDMEALKRVIGVDVLAKAFSSEGDGVGKLTPLESGLLDVLAIDAESRDAVARQIRGVRSIEIRAKIESDFQRSRGDISGVEPVPGEKTVAPDCDEYGNLEA